MQTIDFDQLQTDIVNGRNVYLTNYSDGEVVAMTNTGDSCPNIDGHEYFPELCAELLYTFQVPRVHKNYIYTLNLWHCSEEAKKEMLSHLFNTPSFAIYNATSLHCANCNGTIGRLIAQIRKDGVVIVGPKHLEGLPEQTVSFKDHIVVPDKNCYLDKKRIIEQTIESIKSKSPRFVTVSCSLMANLVLYELWRVFDDSICVLNFGSNWDPYVGVNSRGAYTSAERQQNLQRNISEANRICDL